MNSPVPKIAISPTTVVPAAAATHVSSSPLAGRLPVASPAGPVGRGSLSSGVVSPVDHGLGEAAVSLSPDRALLARLLGSGGESLRQCMQCATCSSVCELASAQSPFPRKEMLWAQWGMKARLMADLDLWICHECHQCTRRCPRGARPGDVMAALRRECVIHYCFASPVGIWLARPVGLVVVAVASALALASAMVLWQAGGAASAELTTALSNPRIVFPFWERLPRGLLVTLFGGVLAFDVVAAGTALFRFGSALTAALPAVARNVPARSRLESAIRVIGRIGMHDDFGACTFGRGRHVNHALVVYGMLGLCLVDLWVVVAPFNPLVSGFVYPMSFLDPWKILGNVAGLALLAGSVGLAWQRGARSLKSAAGTFWDWSLLALLALVVLTGFATELLHFARLEALRHGAYFVHLTMVLTFLFCLPYSKLAHGAYRAVAMVIAERYGRLRWPAAEGEHGDPAKVIP